MHILMAEDDPLASRILTTELRRLGHSIKTLPDGRSALHFFHVTRPDVIISDWMMPGMDGLKFCRAIREIESPYYPYFILITARDRPEDFQEGMAAGVDDFLTKPVSIEQLQRRLTVAERIVHRQQKANPTVGEICMCASCKNIRWPDGLWEPVNAFLSLHTSSGVTHGLCPTCAAKADFPITGSGPGSICDRP